MKEFRENFTQGFGVVFGSIKIKIIDLAGHSLGDVTVRTHYFFFFTAKAFYYISCYFFIKHSLTGSMSNIWSVAQRKNH